MSDEPTRAELESHLHYYQNRATESEPRLAAATARIRELEVKYQSERRRADAMEVGLASIERTARDIVRAHRTALAPPPEDEKRGGE